MTKICTILVIIVPNRKNVQKYKGQFWYTTQGSKKCSIIILQWKDGFVITKSDRFMGGNLSTDR